MLLSSRLLHCSESSISWNVHYLSRTWSRNVALRCLTMVSVLSSDGARFPLCSLCRKLFFKIVVIPALGMSPIQLPPREERQPCLRVQRHILQELLRRPRRASIQPHGHGLVIFILQLANEVELTGVRVQPRYLRETPLPFGCDDFIVDHVRRIGDDNVVQGGCGQSQSLAHCRGEERDLRRRQSKNARRNGILHFSAFLYAKA